MRRARRVLATAALAAVALTLSAPAFAGENGIFGVTLDPVVRDGQERRSFDIPFVAGATFEDAVAVTNNTDHRITVAVYPASATDADGVVQVGFRNSGRAGLAGAVRPAVRSLDLAPHERRRVPFKVALPRANTLGSMAALVVESAPQSGQSLDLVQRVAILVRITGDQGAAGPPIGRFPGGGSSLWWAALVLLAVGIAVRVRSARRPALR